MDTYRIINRELSINNQQLRTVIHKLKHEITYLNRQIMEQREEFANFKESIAKTIEQKYIETISLIFPDKLPDHRKSSKLDNNSHRRSYKDATVADPVQNKSIPPPASLESNSDMDEPPLKSPASKLSIEMSRQLSKSPENSIRSMTDQSQSIKSTDSHKSNSFSEEQEDSVNSDLGQTLTTINKNLVTITEEKTCSVDTQNETLSDATINCLLDAPCSTPYNQNPELNESPFQQKGVRIYVKKISEEQLANMSPEISAQLSSRNSNLNLSSSRLRNSLFKSKSAQIEACHSEKNIAAFESSHRKTISNSFRKSDYNLKSFAERRSLMSNQVLQGKDTSFSKQNKENYSRKSDRICSDEEGHTGRRRLRIKQVSLKEPSLRSKLRNTKNIKM